MTINLTHNAAQRVAIDLFSVSIIRAGTQTLQGAADAILAAAPPTGFAELKIMRRDRHGRETDLGTMDLQAARAGQKPQIVLKDSHVTAGTKILHLHKVSYLPDAEPGTLRLTAILIGDPGHANFS